MSALEKAEEAVRDAQVDSRTLELITAVLAAQQATQQAVVPVQQVAPVQAGQMGKWIGIGIGGSMMLATLAVSMVAFAIGAISVTICALILRHIWQDIQRGK